MSLHREILFILILFFFISESKLDENFRDFNFDFNDFIFSCNFPRFAHGRINSLFALQENAFCKKFF